MDGPNVPVERKLLTRLSVQPDGDGFHGQEKVYKDLGEEMLQHSFDGTKIIQHFSEHFLQ